MSYNKTKTDPVLGQQVHDHLVKMGVETPVTDNGLSRTDKIDKIEEHFNHIMNTLGLAKFSNPIGIAMVLRNAYKQAKNPVLTEEDMTLGLMTDTQKDVIDKQVKMGKAIGSFDPDATFKAAKIFDDKGSGGVFGIGKREAEPMTREEYNEYISQKGFNGLHRFF